MKKREEFSVRSEEVSNRNRNGNNRSNDSDDEMGETAGMVNVQMILFDKHFAEPFNDTVKVQMHTKIRINIIYSIQIRFSTSLVRHWEKKYGKKSEKIK